MKWKYKVTGGHTHVQVSINGAKCGDLCFRNEEFDLIRFEAAKCEKSSPIHVFEDSERDQWKGVYPGMCMNLEECRGKTSCPRSLSCCE